MKIAHWTWGNTSGMHRVAESLAKTETLLGHDSRLVWTDSSADLLDWAMEADVHVGHTHLSEKVWSKKPRPPVVWVGHGTPEVVFHSTAEEHAKGKYGAGDAWMLIQYWMQHADAMVTFWPRHHAIWRSLCDKRTIVECFPLGVDKEFWKPVPSLGKYVGNPAVLSSENCYEIKWPLDLLIAWPWVCENVPSARLHLTYVPNDQHRYWFPLVNRNGSSFSSYISSKAFSHTDLRNALCSVDYYIGLVRYGDFNRMALEVKATGCKLISYVGNIYADYWVPEGDQRVIAETLTAILKGDVAPREDRAEVPNVEETAKGMISLYERLI